MITSKYWTSAYLVWVISLIYFHSIVSLEAFNIIYIDHTTSFIFFKLDNFLYRFRIVTTSWWGRTWLCTGSGTSLRWWWEMIDGFTSYFLNIASTRLKLLYLVLYLVHKGQLMRCFCSIIFFKSRFARYDFVAISISSSIQISLGWIFVVRFNSYIILWFFYLLNIIVLNIIICFSHIIISDLIIIFTNFVITPFTLFIFQNTCLIIIIFLYWLRFFISIFFNRVWIVLLCWSFGLTINT